MTKQEQKQLQTLIDGYEKLGRDQEALIESLRSDSEPPAVIRPKKGATRDEISKISEKNAKAYEEWEAAGSQEWRDARQRLAEIVDKQTTAIVEYRDQIEKKYFSKLGGDPTQIE